MRPSGPVLSYRAILTPKRRARRKHSWTPNRADTTAPSANDLAYQAHILPGVSRTFALTIPVLPSRARGSHDERVSACAGSRTRSRMTSAWTTSRSPDSTHASSRSCRATAPAEPFAADLLPLLSTRVLPAERDLVRNAARVIRVTHAFSTAEQAALTRCVGIMCTGMPKFQRNKSLRGLADLAELAQYCYFVAGVVGEMCTELFCLHCPELAQHARRNAAARSVVRPGPPDDEHPEGHLGRSSGAALAGYRARCSRAATSISSGSSSCIRPARFAKAGRAHRHRSRAPAQRARIHVHDSEARGRDPQVLPLGHRSRGAHAAQHSSQPRRSVPAKTLRCRAAP